LLPLSSGFRERFLNSCTFALQRPQRCSVSSFRFEDFALALALRL
jgi:hypothetical protein